MSRKVPDDIGVWVAALRREVPKELNVDERRAMNDLLHGVLHTAFVHLAARESERFAASESMNLLDSAGAAEVTRLQGGRREFVAIIEQLWEMADDAQD